MQNIDPRLAPIKDCLYRVAVKALVMQDAKYLLVKDRGDTDWSFPGGGIDYGESALAALIRELHEEIGVNPQDIATDGVIVFTAIGHINSGIPRLNLFYKVTVPVNKVIAGKDVSDFGWFSLAQIQKLKLNSSTGDILGQLQKLN